MDDFFKTHPLFEADDKNTSASMDASVPAELRNLMQLVRGNSYAQGFFRFISPPPFRDYFALWGLAPDKCLPFIKCAFGHLVFYHQGRYKVLNPVHNCIDVLGEADELDFVMDFVLCDRVALENAFLIDVYEQVFPRLGAPGIDEMYALVPALGLGGSRDPANVQRVAMRTQMPILAQL